MSVTDFELEVLNWLLADYENPRTITMEISKKSQRTVAELEVSNALQSLVFAGFADKYVFNLRTHKFLLVGGTESVAESELWYFATGSGREECSRHDS